MAKFTFADRYVEAGLSPTPQIIALRQGPAKLIVENIDNIQIIDLVSVFFGSTEVNLEWFRDEFFKEDISFSLVNHERETRVLAALILSDLIDEENAIAILAITTGSVRGLRSPLDSAWLVNYAEESLLRLSVEERQYEDVQTKVTTTSDSKLSDAIAELGVNDWPGLTTTLEQIRTEAQSSAKSMSTQIAKALKAFDCQVSLMQEESQMLWWLIGGHSRTFERSFSVFGAHQAALVGAVDLGALTTTSRFGPIAIPAMLERVIASAKKPKGQKIYDLGTVIDSFTVEDLEQLDVPTQLSALLAPISSAVVLARTMGIAVWQTRFQSKADLEPSILLSPVSLAEQLYREHLLGQLL
ncbi:GTPase-associated system all-helical protein GASH [Yersinia mollaretii]|uniref:GTPase-associated system all-helical protein GASH n=1 Tax=Yersinia mollaretii TaxID=33060 RepID=UPI0011A4FF7E|nr:GTPase-associated system all-helical protein GASH [Yersinia mollaretii]